MKITEQNLIGQFLLAFPEVECSYQKEVESWEGELPGNYNVFAFVFKPFLKDELAKAGNEDFLRRFCSFMERACLSEDSEAVNVIWLKVFKFLLSDSVTLKRLWPLLGPATKSNIEDAAARWGKIGSLPVPARPKAVLFLLKFWHRG
jgi:hypothetical protein